MSKKMDGVDVAMLSVVLVIGYPLAMFYEAWIVVKMWGWFIVPAFPSAPHLTMAVAVGIGLLIALLRPIPTQKTDYDSAADIAGRAIGGWFLNPTWILVTATAVHLWFQ